MVREKIKYGYYLITLVFSVLTIIEILVYMKMYSNILGVIYLYINFFILFMLFTVSTNYSKANKKIRFSKNMITVILGIVASFLISLFIPYLISYTDSSFVFQDKIFLISKILKPLIYLFLICLSFIESNLKIRIPFSRKQCSKN